MWLKPGVAMMFLELCEGFEGFGWLVFVFGFSGWGFWSVDYGSIMHSRDAR